MSKARNFLFFVKAIFRLITTKPNLSLRGAKRRGNLITAILSISHIFPSLSLRVVGAQYLAPSPKRQSQMLQCFRYIAGLTVRLSMRSPHSLRSLAMTNKKSVILSSGEESRNYAGYNGILHYASARHSIASAAVAPFRMTGIIKIPLLRGGRGCIAFWMNKPKRQKLTASVLTFVMLFQIVAGIFAPVNIFNLNKPMVANASWYGNDWGYRKEIKVDHTKVLNTDQAYFPMLVSFTDSALKTVANGGKVENPSGYLDIMFTAVNGTTKLDHEIEKYVTTTGELKAWVKIPSLSASIDTSIYIYYGNSTIAASQENKTGVWDDGGGNNFKGCGT